VFDKESGKGKCKHFTWKLFYYLIHEKIFSLKTRQKATLKGFPRQIKKWCLIKSANLSGKSIPKQIMFHQTHPKINAIRTKSNTIIVVYNFYVRVTAKWKLRTTTGDCPLIIQQQ
jgi:hypothetical protein